MKTLEQFISNATVVLAAGGEASRFQSVPGANRIQKAAFLLPNGETMIERTIKMYRDLGLKNFALLVYNHAGSVEKLLGDGSVMGVNIVYSYDPGKPVGRGGAMRHAIEVGAVPKGNFLIVHNPDDQIVTNPVEVLREAILAHLARAERGAIGTAIMVKGTPYEFSGFQVEDDFVLGAEMYPFIHMPTHIGMTIFSPEVTEYFERLFSLTEKVDFESVLFPELTNEKKLASHFIPDNSWISVNDQKGLKKLIKAIEEENSNMQQE